MRKSDHNMTMPQAKFFFVYVLWREQDPNPLQVHLAFGFTRESTEETRRLVRSGTQVMELLSMSEVHDLLPYHHRKLNEFTARDEEQGGDGLPPTHLEDDDAPGTDGVLTSFFAAHPKVAT